jgi:peroxiredoxin
MSLRRLLPFAAVGLLLAPANAQLPEVGSPAPAITATTWLHWEGPAPTLESLAGRVVLLEFWGTWCGPCVQAMPGIQKLHDRYRERGLTVLAISYETPDKMQPFLQKNGYTMPVGSDPEKKTITAYGVRGWPTTIVLDKDGKVAHVGSPYDAEAAVEAALGLEAGPVVLLTAYLDSLKAPDPAAQREALERLVEKAAPGFDLQAWARGQLPAETTTEGATATPQPAAASKGATAPKPAAATKPVDPAELLRRCSAAWAAGGEPRAALLRQLAGSEARNFDLARFARESFAKSFPFDAKELAELLRDHQFRAVVDAITQRAPAAAVLAAAAKDADLAAWCEGQAPGARKMAKKGLMAHLYVFPGALPKDEQKNEEFFRELSISGIATTKDKKRITGILLGGEQLPAEAADAFVDAQLTQALLMEDLGANKAPRLPDLAKRRSDARAAIARDLEARYGKPEPRQPK